MPNSRLLPLLSSDNWQNVAAEDSHRDGDQENMNWQQLKQYLDKGYDFLDRVGVNGSAQQKGIAVHPLLRMSTSLALKAMSSIDRGRLVLLLPNRLTFAKWLAALCTLDVMRKDYEQGAGVAKYSRGQKLLVSRRIVEYLGEEFDTGYNRWYMWVRCKDGDRNRIPLDRALAFQPITSERPLSSLQAIGEAVSSAQHLDSPIDGVLRILTMGNKSIFKTNIILASRIGDTVRFANENQINGGVISDLFLWGKLDTEGNVTIIGSQNIKANPCCLVSPDLIGAWHYVCDNPKATQGIIIDGVADYINNLPVLDDLLDKKIPVIIVSDMLETEHLQYFSDRDFKIWQWNKKNIVQSGAIVEPNKLSPFSMLNNSIFNYCNQKVNTIHCEYPEMDNIVRQAIELDRLIPHDHHNIYRAYGKLIQLVNEYSRLIRIPDQSWSDNSIQKLRLLWQQIKLQKLWLSDQAILCIDTIFNALISLAEKPFKEEKHKPDHFHELMNKLSGSGQVSVIVAKPDEVGASQIYWQGRYQDKRLANIHFLALPDLLGQNEPFIPEHIVICGWLGRDKMFPLLHSHIASDITMLMYPFEAEWFRYASNGWNKQNDLNVHAKDFSEMLGLPEKDLDAIEYKPEVSIETLTKEEFSIAEFELKLRTSRYQSYVSSAGIRDEVIAAKLVVFAGDRFAFLTGSHRLPVVTEVIREEGSDHEIPRKDVTQLQIGDYVLFQESNRDIIREIADRGLAKEGKSHMRKVAGLWRDVLRDSYRKMSGNTSEFIELLRMSGCKRHPQTIRNWLTDDDQIGPGRMTDLGIIARALSNKELTERIAEVKAAISVVRGAHLQASSYIRNKLLANLPEIVGVGKGSSGNGSGSVLLNLDEFGQIVILRIEEIGNDWQEVPTNTVNCLLMEEE